MCRSTHAQESVDRASGPSAAGDRRHVRGASQCHTRSRAADRRTSKATRFSSPREDDDSGPPIAIRPTRSVAMSDRRSVAM
jgi:hypothetical protein